MKAIIIEGDDDEWVVMMKVVVGVLDSVEVDEGNSWLIVLWILIF